MRNSQSMINNNPEAFNIKETFATSEDHFGAYQTQKDP